MIRGIVCNVVCMARVGCHSQNADKAFVEAEACRELLTKAPKFSKP